MRLVRKGSWSGFQRSPVSISAAFGYLCFHEMLSISEIGSPHFVTAESCPCQTCQCCAQQCSYICAQGLFVPWWACFGWWNWGEINAGFALEAFGCSGLCWGSLCHPSPPAAFQGFAYNSPLVAPGPGCAVAGPGGSAAGGAGASLPAGAAAGPERCSSRGGRWVSPALPRVPAQPGRERGRWEGGGGAAAASAGAAARLCRQHSWDRAAAPRRSCPSPPEARHGQLRAGTGHERGAGRLKELGRSRWAAEMGNQPGRAEEHEQGVCERRGAAAPRGWRFVLCPLGRHGAVVTARAGGFQPAGDTAAVCLVNALYCRSVPEITAPSLGELFCSQSFGAECLQGRDPARWQIFYFFFFLRTLHDAAKKLQRRCSDVHRTCQDLQLGCVSLHHCSWPEAWNFPGLRIENDAFVEGLPPLSFQKCSALHVNQEQIS